VGPAAPSNSYVPEQVWRFVWTTVTPVVSRVNYFCRLSRAGRAAPAPLCLGRCWAGTVSELVAHVLIREIQTMLYAGPMSEHVAREARDAGGVVRWHGV